jgi:hypothetical protein
MREKPKKITSMERLGEDVGDLVSGVDVLEVSVAVVDDVTKIVKLEKHMTNAFGIDGVLGLRNAGGVVLEDRSRRCLTKTEFSEELAEINDCASGVEGSDVLGFGGRLGDNGLEIRAPVNKRAAEINERACGALGGVNRFAAPGGVGECFESETGGSGIGGVTGRIVFKAKNIGVSTVISQTKMWCMSEICV